MKADEVKVFMDALTLQLEHPPMDVSKSNGEKLAVYHPLFIKSNIDWFKRKSEILSKLSDEELSAGFKLKYISKESNDSAGLIPTIHAKDLLSIKDPKDEFLIDPFIPKGQIILVFSKPKKKKSLFALYTGSCLAAGTKFLGKYPVKKAGVMYLLGEDPERTARKRLRTITKGLRIHVSRRRRDKFPFFLVNRTNCREFNDSYKDNIINTIMKNDVRLLILDTISIFLGEDEDSNRAESIVKVFKKLFSVVDETGVSILLLYHANKKGRELLGSMKFEANSDVIYRLDYDKSKDAMVLGCYNSRDIQKGVSFKVIRNEKDTKFEFVQELDGIIDDGSNDGTNSKNITKENLAKEIILDSLEEDVKSYSELLKLCKNEDMSKRTFDRAINFLYEKEKLIGYDRKKGGYYII